MQRVVWLTDIHLNCVSARDAISFIDSVGQSKPDAVLIGGDVAEWPDVIRYLRQFAERLTCPIYFVLGNHDYYFNSVANVRRQIARLCADTKNLIWLAGTGVVEITTQVGLVGNGGWADVRLGDYERSVVMLNDYRLIAELAGLSKQQRRPVLESLADEAATHIRQVLPTAMARHEHVYLLTHVPPFREACWYNGRISDDHWMPHFTCRAMGDAIREIAADAPSSQLTVLCGHTHGHGEVQLADNLRVLTGGAEYGAPEIQRVFEIT